MLRPGDDVPVHQPLHGGGDRRPRPSSYGRWPPQRRSVFVVAGGGAGDRIGRVDAGLRAAGSCSYRGIGRAGGRLAQSTPGRVVLRLGEIRQLRSADGSKLLRGPGKRCRLQTDAAESGSAKTQRRPVARADFGLAVGGERALLVRQPSEQGPLSLLVAAAAALAAS